MDQHEEFRSSKMVKVTLKFTPEELLERVHELDDARRNRDTLDDSRKKVGKDYRTAQSHCEVLAAEICTGEGEREVEADEVVIFATNTVVIRRRDNGEVISSRPMTPAERQPNLFIVKDGEAVNTETGEIATVHSLSARAEKARQKKLKKEAEAALDATADAPAEGDGAPVEASSTDDDDIPHAFRDHDIADIVGAVDEGSLIDASFVDPTVDPDLTNATSFGDEGDAITDPEAVLTDDAGVDAPAPVKAKRSHKKKAST